ncbi:PAS domain S-box protein [Methylocystis sp. H4A]|nr:PAS domain S-box protein [Methylocystis sp. H4A]
MRLAMPSKPGQYRDYLAAIVDGALDGIVAIDETGSILSFNRAATALFGYGQDEVIGRNVRMLMPEPYRREHDTYLRNYRETGQAKIIGIGRQVEGQRRDGSIFPMELGVTEVEQDGRHIFVGIIHDLSERRKFEARMQELHAGRLELIEHMAVGLAHELKQPLTAINAYLNIVRRLLKDQHFSAEKAEDALDKTTKEVFRVSEIMDNLRQFMARGTTDRTAHHLNEVVRTACEFTDAMSKEAGVTTAVHLDANEDQVTINKVQIQQVVVNLKRNAIEAMQGCENRQLTVSTRLAEGDMIRVDVTDTGPGLPDIVKQRLFEPFTTTKPHGLGVGLSVSRSIIEEHHGKLWAEENPGGGTVFSFALPVTRA